MAVAAYDAQGDGVSPRGAVGLGAPALAVHAALRDRRLDVDVEVAPGEVVAVVGPNGAGKSSLLRLVTGQLRPDAGTVDLGGVRVAGPGVFVPVHRRGIALVEQRPLLFEHLDVADNVAFGLRARGVPRGPARIRARAHLDRVGCGELASRRPWSLSGGQAQRVAIARALATEPTLLLLDEPMAALDVTVAPAVRTLLREVLADESRTALLVTHDVIDALALADRLVLIEDGRVVADGAVEAVLGAPRTAFLADLVGMNLLSGVALAGDALDVGGQSVTGVLAGGPLRAGRHALATFPPAAVGVYARDPGGSPRNHLPAVVATLEPRGPLVRVSARLTCGDHPHVAADLTAAAAVELDLRPGLDVRLVVKATQVTLYER